MIAVRLGVFSLAMPLLSTDDDGPQGPQPGPHLCGLSRAEHIKEIADERGRMIQDGAHIVL